MAAAVPPGEYSPEYLAADRRPNTIIGMSIATGVACVVVVTRIYSRWRFIQKFGLDDALICVAMIISMVLLAVMIMIIHYGAGQHFAAIDPTNLVPLYKWLVAGQLIYMLNLYICRLSGLAFYARLNSMPRYVLYLRASFGFITTVYIAQTLIIALQCIPLSTLWGAAKGTCVSSTVVNIVTATLTVICDSIILVLPMNIIFNMKAKLARKLGLAFVLCFGVFAIITSILRTISMIPVVTQPKDATWFFSVVLAWSSAEISAAIIALSLPALKPLFSSKYRKEKDSNYDQSHSNSNSRSHHSAGGSDFLLNKFPQKGKIYGEVKAYSNTVKGGRSASEEMLWMTTGVDDEGIQVSNTVKVTVRDTTDA